MGCEFVSALQSMDNKNSTDILLDTTKTNAPRAKLQFRWSKGFVS